MPSGKPCGAAVSIEAAIAPIRGELLVQFRMQRKAAPRQRREGCPIAPVTRQKPRRTWKADLGKCGISCLRKPLRRHRMDPEF
jgi:hypothetical protein